MRMLVIGYGSIARKHVAALRKIKPEAVVIALRSQPNADEVAGVTNVFSLAEAMALEPDFALLSNPTQLRAEWLVRLVPFAIPLFIEKPVLSTTASAPALRAQIENSKVLTYTACNLRFLECLDFVRGCCKEADSEPNEVTVYCGSYLPGWRSRTDWRSSYSARPELGGGVHLDLIHELDYLYWIFGEPQAVRALRRSASSLNIPAVDYAHYQLLYPSFVATATLNYFRKEYKRTIEIVFPERTLVVDLASNRVVDGYGKIVFEGTGTIADTYETQMRYFINLLESGNSSFNTFTDGLAVLKIALADE